MSTPTLDRIACHGNRRNPLVKGLNGTTAFIESHFEPNWIDCVDGYRLSVIAGWGAYSTPRPDFMDEDYAGPYAAVEVMASDVPESWVQYDSSGVYASVPVQLVRDLIESHGGEA